MSTAADAAEPGGRIRRRSPITGRTVATAVVLGVLIYLIIGPLVMLFLSTFRDSHGALPFSPIATWTLDNYPAVLGRESTWRLLVNTFGFSLGALFLGFTVACMLAWLTERTNMPFRNVLFVAVVASLGIPNVIIGIAWDLVLNPVNGLVNVFLRQSFGFARPGPIDLYTLPGMIFVQGISLVPITYLLVSAAFRAIDVSMEDAGAAAGAPFRTVMRRVTLPLLTPALLSAFVYQFVTVVESFDIPLVIGIRAGIPVLSTQIYVQAHPASGLPEYGLASTYSLFLLAIALGPLVLYNRIISKSERYATITGRGYTPRRIDLGVWKVPAALFGLGFVILSFVTPALTLFWASIQPFYALPSAESFARITFAAYGEVFRNPATLRAITNTLILAVSVATGTLILGTLVSWILVRTKSRARVLLDLLAFLPHAMPGVIIGLSILLIYLIMDRALPFPVYGTLLIIIIAQSTQYVSLATRLMSAGIAQIKLELEEAADISGASWGATVRRILLPLIRPAFINGYLLVFLGSIKNLTLPLILGTPQTVVLSTLVFGFWDKADTASTGAVGILALGITVVMSIFLRRATLHGGTLVA